MATTATALKEEGNALLTKGKYLEAHAKYTEAINASSGKDTAVLYCNRAQANLLLKRWDYARYDAADALVADPNFLKAWLRLGRAYDGMKDFGASGRAYSIGMNLSKDNAPLMRALDEASRESRQAFNSTPYGLPPCDPPKDPARVALSRRLKDEGDALVPKAAAGDFDAWIGSYVKFTLALAFDRSSAVLYCKRAHLCLLQKWWNEAIEDGEMAMHIDSEYLDGHWRTAAGYLGADKLPQSREIITGAYLRALEIPAPLSPADEELRDNILSLKNDVEAKLRRAAGLQANQPDAPWILAQQAIRKYNVSVRDTWYTSAWTMTGAYKDFSTGVALLCQNNSQSGADLLSGQFGPMFQRMAQGLPDGGSIQLMQSAIGNQSETIEPMTNGLLTDLRAFHVPLQDFKQRVINAIPFESMISFTFKESEPRALVQAVKSRLRQTNGWDATARQPVSTRKSVAMTVRIWIMQAILAWKIDEDHERACTLFRRTVDFLELGRREWANVTRDFRGAIFETTFLLIIERAYLECCVERFTTRASINAPGSSTLLETIKDVADKVLAQMAQVPGSKKTPQPDTSAPDCITFLVYPEAVAHDAAALYYKTKADEPTSDGEKQKLLSKSADHLTKSVALYPTDEELRCEALYQLIDCKFRTHRPLAEVLPLCDALTVSVRKSRDIWRASALSLSGDGPRRWETYLSFAKEAKHGIMRKRFKREDVVSPATLAAAPE
ncbi:TPR-like protein [Auricularia subglabra TFB-10046 SS5]|nr:TPR-like protein [Auricularia subglabra TFB-10046 SS5]